MAQVSELTRTAITTAEADHFQPGYHLADKLKVAGVNVLGNGWYGAAIEEDGQVFKIFGREEAGYGQFVKYLKGKSSTLLPRINHVGSFGAWQVVQIERLYNLDDELGIELAMQVGDWIAYTFGRHLQRMGIRDFYWLGKRPSFPKEAEGLFNKANFIGLLVKMADYMQAYNAENSMTIRFDIHRGNVMVRRNADGTRQLVITDPWAQND